MYNCAMEKQGKMMPKSSKMGSKRAPKFINKSIKIYVFSVRLSAFKRFGAKLLLAADLWCPGKNPSKSTFCLCVCPLLGDLVPNWRSWPFCGFLGRTAFKRFGAKLVLVADLWHPSKNRSRSTFSLCVCPLLSDLVPNCSW